MNDEGTEQTKKWLSCYQRLKDQRVSTQDQIWQDIANYVSPRKAGITEKRYMPDSNKEAQIYDATATDSVQRAVSAYTSWTTPASQPWISLKPNLKLKNDDSVKGWLSECSQILNQEVNSRSNFQLERLESVVVVWFIDSIHICIACGKQRNRCCRSERRGCKRAIGVQHK